MTELVKHKPQRLSCLGWLFGSNKLFGQQDKPVITITEINLVQPLNPRAGILKQGTSSNEAGELYFARWKRKLLKRQQKEVRVKKAKEKEKRRKMV
ncbi:MAG: hypothetical protein AAB441_04950 [Patescibacteria group bacterium]